MSVNIHILGTSKEIRPYVVRLRSLAKSAVKSIKKLLPLKNIDVVFYYNPEGVIKEAGGIGGYAPSANNVFISLDPRHPRFRHALKKELVSQLAHELHHAIRWRKPGYGTTLFEAMVTEGLADHFSMEVVGGKTIPPWSRALTSKQREAFLRLASREWHKPNYNHRDWFFGSKKRAIPRWTGYTLGYFLVEEYLRIHPEDRASILVDVKF